MQNVNVDTIAAQATPPGRGGIAIIRLSGPKAKSIAQQLLNSELKPREATYLSFLDADQTVIDQGIAIFFPNPHSFTGEDVVELQGHGGTVVVDLVLQRLLDLGARLAKPGEFSERAFLNGKIDLVQAEAIADLIDASSTQAARSAMRSLQGEFSNTITALTEKLTRLRIYIEAAIDFSDEEIDFLAKDNIASQMQIILADIVSIQQKAKQGSFLREGFTAVIAGAPNAGKSSLLNCLSGKDVAIVTAIPGTTRDVLRDHILLDDIPMHIIDTAGLRESDDIVEQEGIRRAHHEMQQADIILHVCDASIDATYALPDFTEDKPVIVVKNKIDLINETPAKRIINNVTHLFLSAKSGTGIDLLKQEIKHLIGVQSTTEGMYLARRRHLDALARASEHITDSLTQLQTTKAGELAAEDLRLAQQALGEITGELTADDLLGRIFSSFCIGK